jgi:hypothetical protein
MWSWKCRTTKGEAHLGSFLGRFQEWHHAFQPALGAFSSLLVRGLDDFATELLGSIDKEAHIDIFQCPHAADKGK